MHRPNAMRMIMTAMALGLAGATGGVVGGEPYQRPALIGGPRRGKSLNSPAERKKHVPKRRRLKGPKFNGKQPMVLSKKEHSFQLAHRLPGGVLMQPWQVKACLNKYSAETPASFA